MQLDTFFGNVSKFSKTSNIKCIEKNRSTNSTVLCKIVNWNNIFHTCSFNLAIHNSFTCDSKLSYMVVFCSVTNQYQIRVRVGEHSFYVDEGTEDSVIVSNIIVHPSYVHSANKNDIAMIKLSKPVDMTSKYLSTACLPDISDMDEFYRTSECYTTGWGKTQGGLK